MLILPDPILIHIIHQLPRSERLRLRTLSRKFNTLLSEGYTWSIPFADARPYLVTTGFHSHLANLSQRIADMAINIDPVGDVTRLRRILRRERQVTLSLQEQQKHNESKAQAVTELNFDNRELVALHEHYQSTKRLLGAVNYNNNVDNAALFLCLTMYSYGLYLLVLMHHCGYSPSEMRNFLKISNDPFIVQHQWVHDYCATQKDVDTCLEQMPVKLAQSQGYLLVTGSIMLGYIARITDMSVTRNICIPELRDGSHTSLKQHIAKKAFNNRYQLAALLGLCCMLVGECEWHHSINEIPLDSNRSPQKVSLSWILLAYSFIPLIAAADNLAYRGINTVHGFFSRSQTYKAILDEAVNSTQYLLSHPI